MTSNSSRCPVFPACVTTLPHTTSTCLLSSFDQMSLVRMCTTFSSTSRSLNSSATWCQALASESSMNRVVPTVSVVPSFRRHS